MPFNARNARHAQVVLTEEEHVDAVHGRDGVDVDDALRRLNLDGDEHVLVAAARVSRERERERAEPPTDALPT